MASLLTSSSFSRTSRTLSANQTVSSSFSSTPNTFAMMGIWLRFAFRSPRSILLYIGVSISNATQRWRWKSPCSSLNCFIFCPNTTFYFSTNLCRFSTNFSTNLNRFLSIFSTNLNRFLSSLHLFSPNQKDAHLHERFYLAYSRFVFILCWYDIFMRDALILFF